MFSLLIRFFLKKKRFLFIGAFCCLFSLSTKFVATEYFFDDIHLIHSSVEKGRSTNSNSVQVRAEIESKAPTIRRTKQSVIYKSKPILSSTRKVHVNEKNKLRDYRGRGNRVNRRVNSSITEKKKRTKSRLPQFEKELIKIKYQAAQEEVIREIFSGDQTKRVLKSNLELKKPHVESVYGGISLTDEVKRWLLAHCKYDGRLYQCRGGYSFHLLKGELLGEGDGVTTILFPVKKVGEDCSIFHDDINTVLNSFRPAIVPKRKEFKRGDPLLIPENFLEFALSDPIHKRQIFELPLGRGTAFSYFKESSIELCAFSYDIKAIRGDEGENCSTDSQCLDGCCKNNICISFSASDEKSCAKERGEACLDRSFCKVITSSIVFRPVYNERTKKCSFQGKTGAMPMSCYKNTCRAFYEYREVPKLKRIVAKSDCREGLDPDELEIVEGVSGKPHNEPYHP